MILICGPCVIDNLRDLKVDACEISATMEKHPDIDFYFKASCIKDNRTSLKNYYGSGFTIGIQYLEEVKKEYGMKITTDFHTVEQLDVYGHRVDLIQIPAFLAMQTSLINAAVKIGKPIHIKKPQWLPPYDVKKPVSKVKEQKKDTPVFMTDRGTTFGYGSVMVDSRHIKMMKTSGCDKVIVDITHPQNHSDVFSADYAEQLGMASLAAGADGLFIESTYNPAVAKCDGDSMIPTGQLYHYINKFAKLYRFLNDGNN